jgi:tetratricopeptide (TPR) repeat protein
LNLVLFFHNFRKNSSKMPCLISGFEYDIFISYRQKDNKYDGWVTEFVDNLRKELEATFKEDISVYFDINSHDGLLETHDVQASLKDKLKCLVFIPVISRTYCDPRAFAWEHEMIAFIKNASIDQFGLKVILPNGNVATRVLPVRIHDLDPKDISLCESVLGGPMRGVDFIYKSAGVNRPLRINEDHPQDNQNKTYYRDQINKVANAISDIIHGIKLSKDPNNKKQDKFPENETRGKSNIYGIFRRSFYKRTRTRRVIFLVAFVIIISSIYAAYKYVYATTREKTIAILPLLNVNRDSSLNNDANSFIGDIYDKLSRVRSINVISDLATEPYRNQGREMSSIWDELKTDYLFDGKIQRDKRGIFLYLQLSERKNMRVVWTKPIAWSNDQFSTNTLETVKNILSTMSVRLTKEEELKIASESMLDPDANLTLISANKIIRDAWSFYNFSGKAMEVANISSAIESYDKVIRDNPQYAEAYAKRSIARSWGYYTRQLDSSSIELSRIDYEKALSLDKNLKEAEIAKGFYFYYCRDSLEQAYTHFEKAARKDPGDYHPLYYMAITLRGMGKWNESQRLMRQVIEFNPREALFVTNIGLSYTYLHNYDSAMIFQQKAIDLIPGWPPPYKNKFEALLLKKGKTKALEDILNEAVKKTGDNMLEYFIRYNIYINKYPEAFRLASLADNSDFEYNGMKYIFLGKISSAMSDPNAAKYYDTASVLIEQEIKIYPDFYYTHGLLATAYAGMGKKTDAVKEAEKALKIAAGKNLMDECEMRIILAQVYVMNGDYFNALPCIAKLLNTPSPLSLKMLQTDPTWQPLMDQPEYRNKIRKYTHD